MIFLILKAHKMALKVFINPSTPNPGLILANALQGKHFDKFVINKMRSNPGKTWSSLSIDGRIGKLDHLGVFECNDADFTIEHLRISADGGLSYVPICFLRNSKVITIHDTESLAGAPAEFRSKLRKDTYYFDTKDEMPPNSTYMACNHKNLVDVNFDYISVLVLNCCSVSGLIKMVKCLLQSCASFQEVRVKLFSFCGQTFDVSLLAGIETEVLSFQDGLFVGFKKLVADTATPRIRWTEQLSEYQHARIVDGVMEGLREKVDISTNYTLIEFTTISPYLEECRDILEVVKRNQKLRDNRRFIAVKAIVNE